MVASSEAKDEPGPRPPAAPRREATEVRSVESTALLSGARELVIRHGADVYRLRITANDKLILTK